MKLVTPASRMSAPAATVSPILALGRRLHTEVERTHALDEAWLKMKDGAEREATWADLMHASREIDRLIDAITYLEAGNLEDAAVQIRLINGLVELLSDMDEKDRQEQVRLRQAVQRLCFSISSVLNQATGFGPEDFGSAYYFSEKLNPHRMASPEAQPAIAAE